LSSSALVLSPSSPTSHLLPFRPILYEMNRVLFNDGRGNEEFANLPRKINVCISPSRDDFPHTQVSM